MQEILSSSRRNVFCFHHTGQKRLTVRLTCPSSENWFDSEGLCITFLRTINLKEHLSDAQRPTMSYTGKPMNVKAR